MTCSLIKPNQAPSAPSRKTTEWISQSQLASWGVLEQVLRVRTMDELIQAPAPMNGADQEELLHDWRQVHQLTSPDQLGHWLQSHGLSAEQWQQLVLRPHQWLHWCREEFSHKVKSHFLKRKAELDQLSYSLIRVRDEELAAELFLRIREAEVSFEDCAGTYSEGPERHDGGRVGPVPTTQPHPCLAELLRVSQPGQLWPPRKLEGWWVILRLEAHHGARFSDVCDQLCLELGEAHLHSLVASQLAEHSATSVV